ncbi:MAG: serine/threonine-protein kinase [Myxococcota bacterium]
MGDPTQRRHATRPLEDPRANASASGSRAIPSRVGRFVVLEAAGEGGMGQVLAAYDPVLDRRVALKRVLARQATAVARARLHREARAMAQLSHPGVVAVHDVLEVDGDLYVAMDYVEGRTLRAWLAQRPRPWSELLPLLVAAGRGLAAAHDQGLVHRDFKPDNVLVDEQQRVRVTDFGLATTVADEHDETPRGPSPAEALGSITRTGALLGTPRYMAPELLRGEPADPRSDQFAFCVTLYEALYACDPFDGEATASDRPTPAPRAGAAPEWLASAVLRGLALEPRDRWPSMADLLAELERPRTRGRRFIAASALVGATLTGWWALSDRESCEGAEQALSQHWNDQRRATLRDAMLDTELPLASESWSRVERELDDWAQRWRAGYTAACESHRRSEQSDGLFDRRVACLHQQRWALAAATRVLEAPDARVVQRAARAGGELPPPEACARVEVLLSGAAVPEDPEVARATHALRERFIEARTRADFRGHHDEAVAAYDELIAALDTEALQATSLHAELLHARGNARSGTNAVEAAKADLLAAYTAAERVDDEVLKARAASTLVDLVARRGLALPDVEAWAQLAEVIVQRAEPEGRTHGTVMSVLAKLRLHQGRYDDAIALARRAHTLLAASYGREHARVVVPLTTEATAQAGLGDLDRALALHRRAAEQLAVALGPSHPEVAAAEFNLGSLELETGHPEAAIARFERALSRWREVLGEDHTRVAGALFGLGSVYDAQGRLDDAKRHYEQARAIWEAQPAIEKGNLSVVYNNLASLEARHGRFEQALPLFERSAALEQEFRGREHPAYAEALGSLAAIHLDLGHLPQAEAHAREAIALLRKTVGSDHPRLVSMLANLAQAQSARGAHVEAQANVEEAMALAEDEPRHLDLWGRLASLRLDQGDPAGAREALTQLQQRLRSADVELPAAEQARVLFVQARLAEDPKAGRALAQQALDRLSADDSAPTAAQDEIRAWMAETF